MHVVGSLAGTQQSVFARLVIAYNLAVYPACLAVLAWLVVPVVRVWRRLHEPGSRRVGRVSEVHHDPTDGARGPIPPSEPSIDESQVLVARRRMLTWPAWTVGLACAGWLPGGLVFPLGIHLFAGPVGAGVFGHFILSFTISGLIALTYSYFGVEFLVLRVLYPSLWVEAGSLRQAMAAELAGHGARLRWFQFSAGVIPLIAAVLLMAAAPDVSSAPGFRLLATALLFAGMAGFGLALLAGNLLSRTLAVYANTSVP